MISVFELRAYTEWGAEAVIDVTVISIEIRFTVSRPVMERR